MDPVPGMMNSPLGKQADLVSREDSPGDKDAKSRIGTMLIGSNEKTIASFTSVKGSQRVRVERLPDLSSNALMDLEGD